MHKTLPIILLILGGCIFIILSIFTENFESMNWFLLIIAGLFEMLFAICLGKANQTEGIASKLWFGGFLLCLVFSMSLLIKVTKALPIGTAYAVWTGIGAAGTVLLGIIIFKEPASFWRLFFITTLIGSIIGLKLVSH